MTAAKSNGSAAVADLCREALLYVGSFGFDDAGEIADELIDGVVAVLRRDPRVPITRSELELLLADLRTKIEQGLYERLGGYVDEHQAIGAFVDAIEAT